MQLHQRGIAGAEVIDRQLEPLKAGAGQHLQHQRVIGHGRGLGQLQAQVPGRNPMLGTQPHQRVGQVRHNVAGGEVHGNEVVHATAVPVGHLRHGQVQHPRGQGSDQTFILRQIDELAGHDDPVLGMPPAHQCFETDGRTRAEREQRLVHEFQVPAVERNLQVRRGGFEEPGAQLREQLAQLHGADRFLHRRPHIQPEVAADAVRHAQDAGIEPAHQHHRRATPGVGQRVQQLDAIAIRHLQIQEDDGRRLRGQARPEHVRIGRDYRGKTRRLRDLADDLEKGRLIVDGQDQVAHRIYLTRRHRAPP